MQENAVKSFLGNCQESIPLFFLANVSFAYLIAGSPLFAEQIQFNRDVRPILSENCLACHGFDHAKREAGLRLDTREGALATLDSGHVAVQPGKPD